MTGHDLIRALQALPDRDLPVWVIPHDDQGPWVLEVYGVERGDPENEKYYSEEHIELKARQ